MITTYETPNFVITLDTARGLWVIVEDQEYTSPFVTGDREALEQALQEPDGAAHWIDAREWTGANQTA